MPRRLGLTLVAVLAGLALLTAAHAQVRFETDPAAFPDDEGPEFVGFNLRLDDDGDVVFVLAEEDTGAIPNVRTGFYGGDVPENALEDVDAIGALQRCGDLVELAGGIVVLHDDVTILAAANAYVGALEAIGLTKVADCFEAGCYAFAFSKPDGEILRLRLHTTDDGVQAYFGI